MVALASAGVLSSPASLLARYAGPFGAGLRPDGSGGLALGRAGAGASASPVAAPPARRDDVRPATSGPAVLAQISDAARSLFARMREQGVQAASFDLHLDLDQLGVSVDGRGNRSIEGHSLSVDLHVEAQQGVMKSDQGDVQFEKLHVELEMTETHVLARESADSAPGSSLEDGLKSLGKLLSDATRGSDQRSFGLDDLMKALGDQVGRLHDLLAQITQALQAQAQPRSDDGSAGAPAGAAGAQAPDRGGSQPGPAAQLQSLQMSFEVQLKALLFTRAPAGDQAAGPARPAVESPAAV